MVGEEIGDRASADWLSDQEAAVETDRHADLIAEALWALVRDGSDGSARGGYIVNHGRRHVVVKPVGED